MQNYRRSHSRDFRRYNDRSGGKQRNRNKGASLNPTMFVMKAVGAIEAPYVPLHSFSDFSLNVILQKNVLSHGFRTPTAIQDQAINPILEGKDLVGIANTGTGKTAAFLLPLITKVSKDRNQKVLIVTPTRELAAQIQDEFKRFSLGMGMYSTLCIGGTSLNVQARQLSYRPNFVIGTPGRIKDLENRHLVNLGHYNNVVLDEVDRMLDMGFIHDIRHIISLLSEKRQSLFFSATLPEATKYVMKRFLTNYVTVSIKTNKASHNVDQDIIRIRGKDKVEILHDLLIKEEYKKVLIFGRTKWGVNKLEKNLLDRGFKTAAIHGNKSQAQRQRSLNMLKNNQIQILLATDVASRGLDIDNVTHVINFNPPESYEDYVHRIGRTGRAGKKGVALTFVD